VHFGALYKFNGSNGSAKHGLQADIGGEYAGCIGDAYYSKVNSAITATSLTAAQVREAPALGYSVSNLSRRPSRTIRRYALMPLYKIEP